MSHLLITFWHPAAVYVHGMSSRGQSVERCSRRSLRVSLSLPHLAGMGGEMPRRL